MKLKKWPLKRIPEKQQLLQRWVRKLHLRSALLPYLHQLKISTAFSPGYLNSRLQPSSSSFMEVLDTFADGVFGDGVPFCRASDLTSASPFSSSFSEALEQKGKGLELSKGR